MFEQLSFPGIDPPEPRDDVVTSSAGTDQRMDMRQRARARWRSARRRLADDELIEDVGADPFDLPDGVGSRSPEEYGIAHRRLGWPPDNRRDPPTSFRYHSTARSAWRKHATEEWVPFDDNLSTPQELVSSSRVEELRRDPDTADMRRLPYRELPRVYRNDYGENILIDGNHRAAADHANGRLFFEARVARPEMGAQFQEAARRLTYHQEVARSNAAARGQGMYEESPWDPTWEDYESLRRRIPAHVRHALDINSA